MSDEIKDQAVAGDSKPSEFHMQIQGGMLEALGINMYTSLGKCLVEFIANAHDGNAAWVKVTIPFDEITTARDKIKADKKKARAEAKAAQAKEILAEAVVDGTTSAAESAANGVSLPDVSGFDETLGDTIQIVIADNGHGMSPSEISQKFLPINRQRRLKDGAETNLKSEGGKRNVMGRKGLGKLAGFGTAQKITISTKRVGETFRTIFELNAERWRTSLGVHDIAIPARYEDAPIDEHGTTISLAQLKSDAVRSDTDRINQTIAEAFFGILPADFEILLNGVRVEEKDVEYEFLYPPEVTPGDDLCTTSVEIADVGSLELRYRVKFRNRGQHLAARRRGGRIYCNKRLAAGPALFKLPTGMHNFHAQDYMEGIFVIDALDRLKIDFVNTNRTQLREDNDIVDAVLQRVSDLMKAGIAAHGKFKEDTAEQDIEASESGRILSRAIDQMSSRQKTPAKKILKTIAARYGAGSQDFQEIAPLVLQSMNAGEVLVRLLEMKTDPQTIQGITEQLRELAEIEKSDALKVFRARKDGIMGLRKLTDKGEELWKRKGIEGELHDLFKKDPWLIRPEYSRYLTSDQQLSTVVSKLAKVLAVDGYSAQSEADGEPDKDRPDLVFIMSDTSEHEITIVELKSPTIPLDTTHLAQLESYIYRVESWLKTEHPQSKARVRGYLIGAMPSSDPKKRSENESILLSKIEKNTSIQWEVIGLEELLRRTEAIHKDQIEALEKDLAESDHLLRIEGSTQQTPTVGAANEVPQLPDLREAS